VPGAPSCQPREYRLAHRPHTSRCQRSMPAMTTGMSVGS
jgi:hypothetical protein